MAAAALRLSVGSAKAASTAMPGRPASARGRTRHGQVGQQRHDHTHQRHRQVPVRQVPRQRHSVHSASGQAGHRNHSHWRATPGEVLGPGRGAPVPGPQQHASSRRRPAWRPAQAEGAHGAGSASASRLRCRPGPQARAMAGAPLPASSGRASQHRRRGLPAAEGRRGQAYSSRLTRPAGPVRAWSRGPAAAGPAWPSAPAPRRRPWPGRSRRVRPRRRRRRAAAARRRCAPGGRWCTRPGPASAPAAAAKGRRAASGGSSSTARQADEGRAQPVRQQRGVAGTPPSVGASHRAALRPWPPSGRRP
jgi:hypothetical protein